MSVRRVVRDKLVDIDHRVGQLARMRDALLELLDACECECSTLASPHCAIAEALDDPDADHSIQEAPCTRSN